MKEIVVNSDDFISTGDGITQKVYEVKTLTDGEYLLFEIYRGFVKGEKEFKLELRNQSGN